jgi:hypothetical protein
LISAKEVAMLSASASRMASLLKPLESLQKESKVSTKKVKSKYDLELIDKYKRGCNVPCYIFQKW